MRKLHTRGLVLVALTSLLGAAVPQRSEAQTIPSPYRFIERRHDAGMFVGILQERRGDLGIGPGGGVMIGARYAIEFRGPLAAELSGYVVPTDRVVFQAGEEIGLVPLGKADMVLTGIDARLRFTLTGDRTWRGLAPFVMAGGGVLGAFSEESPLEAEMVAANKVDFGPSALFLGGLGTRWIPGDRLTIRAEATYNFWRQGTPTGWVAFQEDIEGPLKTQWIGSAGLALGVSYRF